MTLIRVPRPWQVAESRVTPERVYRDRRDFLRRLGFAGAGRCGRGGPAAGGDDLYPAQRNPAYISDRPLTEEAVTARYNNFYEFTDQKDPWRYVERFRTRPWEVEVGGLCVRPETFDVDRLVRLFPLEERVYRHRCVEAWSMIVPWIGFPLRSLIDHVQPLGAARYVRMLTFLKPDEAPGQKRMSWYPWPYYEGLTIDEARNDLAFLATGIYGHALPAQHGAPLRLAVPRKYGFKSIKSIVRIDLVNRPPRTFWSDVPTEYDFVANVNPNVPHPPGAAPPEDLSRRSWRGRARHPAGLSGPRPAVHAGDPVHQSRMCRPRLLVPDQDQVERLGILGVVQRGVLQERESGDVGRRELPQQVLATGQHLLEQVEIPLHRPAQALDPLRVALGLRFLDLGRDLVRRSLPDPVEPVDEQQAVGPPGRILRVDPGPIREALLQVADDLHGVDHHLPVVDQDRNQVLSAHLADLRPVVRRHPDRLGLQPLVPQGQGHALHVGGFLDPVQGQHGALLSHIFSPGLLKRHYNHAMFWKKRGSQEMQPLSQQDVRDRIQKILDEMINPAVAGHGGFVEVLEVKDNIAYLRLGGGCQGCGMVNVTLKQGIETTLKDEIPQLTGVIDQTDHAGGTNPYYQPSK